MDKKDTKQLSEAYQKVIEQQLNIKRGPITYTGSGTHESKKDKAKRPDRKQKHKKRAIEKDYE